MFDSSSGSIFCAVAESTYFFLFLKKLQGAPTNFPGRERKMGCYTMASNQVEFFFSVTLHTDAEKHLFTSCKVQHRYAPSACGTNLSQPPPSTFVSFPNGHVTQPVKK